MRFLTGALFRHFAQTDTAHDNTGEMIQTLFSYKTYKTFLRLTFSLSGLVVIPDET